MDEAELIKLDSENEYAIDPRFRALMAAIMINTIQDLTKYSENDPEYHQSKAWLERKDDTNYIFSFQNVCYYLKYDPESRRKRIYNIIEKRRQKKEGNLEFQVGY